MRIVILRVVFYIICLFKTIYLAAASFLLSLFDNGVCEVLSLSFLIFWLSAAFVKQITSFRDLDRIYSAVLAQNEAGGKMPVLDYENFAPDYIIAIQTKYGAIDAATPDKLDEEELVILSALIFDEEFRVGGLYAYLTDESRFTAPYIIKSLKAVGAWRTAAELAEFAAKNRLDFAGIAKCDLSKAFTADTFEEFNQNCSVISESITRLTYLYYRGCIEKKDETTDGEK